MDTEGDEVDSEKDADQLEKLNGDQSVVEIRVIKGPKKKSKDVSKKA